ncbi:MAG TPA: restriction endonuclease subunit S [Anaerolineales bacterium]|nr:restriction endonuclease subunit S [Anaerolineales bacterium]
MSFNEWKILTFDEMPLDIIDGDRGKNYPKKEDFTDKGYCLFLNTGNVRRDGFDFQDLQFITIEKDNELRKGKLKRGDIVLTTRGTLGNIGLYNEIVPFENIRINSGMVILRAIDESLLNIKYLFQFLKSSLFIEQVFSFSSGSAQPQLPIKDLKRIQVNLPNILTQNKIASILCSIDDKIENNLATNQTLEEIARTLFKEWFVHFNYPGADGKMKQSELGEIPVGWEVKPLDEIADFLNGLALQKYPATSEYDYLPVIKIRELKSGITESTDKANNSVPQKYIIKDGDLLFSWSATLVAKFWNYGKGALNQHLFKVTSDKFPLWFCYLQIQHHLDNFKKIAYDKTTTMGHIQRKHITEALCLIPPNLGEMESVFKPIFDKIIANEQQTQTLKQIRDSLLPKLMSGEIDVSNVKL